MTLKLYTNGRETFEALLKAIDTASSSIHIQMFIWRLDTIGLALAESVLKAADRGVQITIIKDLMGGIFEHAEESKASFFHPHLPFHLKVMSSILDMAYPMKGKPFFVKNKLHPVAWQIENHPNVTLQKNRCIKDHSKFYIIDEKLLFLGGINVEDKEVTHDLLGRPYHDFMVSIHSPAIVTDFKLKHKQGSIPMADIEGNTIDFAMNRQLGHERKYHAKASLIQWISRAKVSLHIVMAYIGDPEIMAAISQCANRGVHVCLMVPDKANLQHNLNQYHLKKLMASCNNPISVFLCNHMIHGKLLWIDKDIVSFGSTNLNKQAMEDLQELNVLYSTVHYNHNHQIQAAIDNIQHHSIPLNSAEQVSYNPFIAWCERLV